MNKLELEDLHAIVPGHVRIVAPAADSPLNLHPLIRACAGRPTSEYTDAVVRPELAPATPFPPKPKRARKRTKKGA